MGTVVGASAVGIAGVARSAAGTLLPGIVGNNHNKRWACGPRTEDPPNVVGDEWFESLRPYLPTAGDASRFRTAHEVHCDNPTLMLLSLEIGRIERDWTEEVKGRRRRNRGA